jgi:hypothetical protein
MNLTSKLTLPSVSMLLPPVLLLRATPDGLVSYGPRPAHPLLQRDLELPHGQGAQAGLRASPKGALSNGLRTDWPAPVAHRQYLSLEFLMGRALDNAVLNLNMRDQYKEALGGLGFTFEDLLDEERDAGLGNGGLGRLAACYVDSFATLDRA